MESPNQLSEDQLDAAALKESQGLSMKELVHALVYTPKTLPNGVFDFLDPKS